MLTAEEIQLRVDSKIVTVIQLDLGQQSKLKEPRDSLRLILVLYLLYNSLKLQSVIFTVIIKPM
ncbi:glycosyl transferase group 1 [Paenibacillus sp. NAIST15-1]|nr:glycosyl transferase group 1 [Paenibacillus sp. NAIST15-1]